MSLVTSWLNNLRWYSTIPELNIRQLPQFVQSHNVTVPIWLCLKFQTAFNSTLAKGEPEMQKLHRVSKFFNKWRADPPPPLPSKKGNIILKKEVSQKKHKKALLNLRKNIFSRELLANLSIENHHEHLHGSKYHVFGARASDWVKKNQQKSFLLPSQCARSRSNVKKINMLLWDRILG